ncbi:hypothetical protein ATM97_09425 [Nocardia sp. MH4]|uniref:hypothetical protein n=1 Tax=Nocardia sp. MH4 TaxID=1768677 RepID=UPI001C4E38AA|nr:hypothetical protein [Nocardia sp. MH4]MBW0271083.1 hypothetical protein [Nocardia sp. MH4]
MTEHEPRTIPDGGENAWNWRHAQIVAAFTSREVTDAVTQADRFERIAARWAEGLDAFERAVHGSFATAWAGVAAEAAAAAVRAYVTQARELTPALLELPGLVRAAAEAIVATKYAIPELVVDGAGTSISSMSVGGESPMLPPMGEAAMSPMSGAAAHPMSPMDAATAHRAAASAEENARIAMRERYVVPFGAIDGRIPVLPMPIRRCVSDTYAGRQWVIVGSSNRENALPTGGNHPPTMSGDHALPTRSDPPATGTARAQPTAGNHPSATGNDHQGSVEGEDSVSASGGTSSSATTADRPVQVSSPGIGAADDRATSDGTADDSGSTIGRSTVTDSAADWRGSDTETPGWGGPGSELAGWRDPGSEVEDRGAFGSGGDLGPDVESVAGSTVVSSSSAGVSTAFSGAPGGPGFSQPGGPGVASSVPALPGIEGSATSLGRAALDLSDSRAGSSMPATAVGDRPAAGTHYRPAHDGTFLHPGGRSGAGAGIGPVDNGACGRPEAGRSVPGAVGPVIGANPPTVPAPTRGLDRWYYAGPLGPGLPPTGETERAVPEYLITQANTDALLGDRRPTVVGGVIGGADGGGPDAQHAASARV